MLEVRLYVYWGTTHYLKAPYSYFIHVLMMLCNLSNWQHHYIKLSSIYAPLCRCMICVEIQFHVHVLFSLVPWVRVIPLLLWGSWRCSTMPCLRQVSKYTYFFHLLVIVKLYIHSFSCSEWPLVIKKKGLVRFLQKKSITVPASRSNCVWGIRINLYPAGVGI
jgi:hypothetical protein